VVGVHVRDTGTGDVTVLLLHGQPGRSEDWNPIVDRLRDEFRVIVPDRPGYGRTSIPAQGLFANADAVASMLAERGVDAVTAVGHSWGGGVALALALLHPARVDSLVLAASIGADSSIDQFDRILGAPIIGDALSFAGLRLLSPLLLLPPVRAAVAPVAGPVTRGDLLDRVRHWRSAWRSFVVEQRAMLTEMPRLSAQLSSVDVPAVVMVGASDRMLAPRAAHDLAAALPNGRLVTIERAGHLLQYDAPDEVAAAIRDLAGRSPSS